MPSAFGMDNPAFRPGMQTFRDLPAQIDRERDRSKISKVQVGSMQVLRSTQSCCNGLAAATKLVQPQHWLKLLLLLADQDERLTAHICQSSWQGCWKGPAPPTRSRRTLACRNPRCPPFEITSSQNLGPEVAIRTRSRHMRGASTLGCES